MKKLLLLLSACLVILFVACKSPAEKENKEATATEDKRNIYTADDGHTVGIDVQLNNGAKWEANPETTQGIGKMLGIIADFAPNPTVEDYRGLHKRLATEFQSILQQCTMKGEAHNQLHNYLMPLKDKMDKLGTGNLETCNTELPEIKDYLMKYSHFFFT